ncbi:hypothetical protein BRADI_4g42437v3 [Brachypodium distachyon]|uniref:Uncharacterized protein n=1 Tax=Brachypodium distachyon TaxID=15368 RepID=A0A2K2CTT5_BRADI|nr:hypothetical protein BRADI_4g42437v3 [Brachypodium distachyon]
MISHRSRWHERHDAVLSILDDKIGSQVLTEIERSKQGDTVMPHERPTISSIWA